MIDRDSTFMRPPDFDQRLSEIKKKIAQIRVKTNQTSQTASSMQSPPIDAVDTAGMPRKQEPYYDY